MPIVTVAQRSRLLFMISQTLQMLSHFRLPYKVPDQNTDRQTANDQFGTKEWGDKSEP